MNNYDLDGILVIKSEKVGPRVGVMAVTHGDEPAWIAAHKYLASYFEENKLASWEVLLILWNPSAYQKKTICIEENLNRLFTEDSFLSDHQKNSFEYTRSRQLMPIIGQLDYLLDIHSTNNPGPVFSIVKSNHQKCWDLASILPVEFVSSGWNPYISWTTCDWIEKSGWVGITIECGDHNNPLGAKIAIQSTKKFLQAIGCYNFREEISICKKHFKVLSREAICDASTFQYSRTYINFEKIKPMEEIAFDSKKRYIAPDQDNLAIVFPTKIESIRSGAIKEAYLLGEFVSA